MSITKLSQAITGFASTPATPIPFTVGGTFTLAATAGAATSPVIFTSATATVCTVVTNPTAGGTANTATVTILTGGTCALRANQAADVNYLAAPQQSLSVVITKANQTVTGFNPATPIAYPTPPTTPTVGTFTVTATAGASTSPVVITSATAAICTAGGTNGTTITVLTIGTCTLRANQAANVSYNAAPQVTASIVITKANQAITNIAATPPFPPPPASTSTVTYASGGTFTLAGTAGQSGNPITFASTTPAVCTTGGTNGAIVTMLATGTCTITANQAGNANFNAAPQVPTTITITPQVIVTSQIYNIYPDHLGTPRAITTADAAATKVWEWNNDEVFGNSEATEAPTNTGVFSYNLRFPGQYRDEETKLNYNYFRDYDSSLGRYVQSDPIGLGGGINTFVYVEGTPLLLLDVYGLVGYYPPRPDIPGRGWPVCDGKGGAGMKLPILPEPYNKCLSACLREHELKHISDLRKSDNKLCKGIDKNWIPHFDTVAENNASERAAYDRELACLKTELGKNCKECDEPIKWRIKDIPKQRSKYE